jgi:hypothetical protein
LSQERFGLAPLDEIAIELMSKSVEGTLDGKSKCSACLDLDAELLTEVNCQPHPHWPYPTVDYMQKTAVRVV